MESGRRPLEDYPRAGPKSRVEGQRALWARMGDCGGQARGSGAARLADHYHSDPEHGIIGRRIDTVVADRRRRWHGLFRYVHARWSALAAPRRRRRRG